LDPAIHQRDLYARERIHRRGNSAEQLNGKADVIMNKSWGMEEEESFGGKGFRNTFRS
jgi:hypothetical protein